MSNYWHIETSRLSEAMSVPDDDDVFALVERNNAEYQLVDERLVARRPASLAPEQAAALPLTMLTGWELLFERMGMDPGGGEGGRELLVIGAGGGMGAAGIFEML